MLFFLACFATVPQTGPQRGGVCASPAFGVRLNGSIWEIQELGTVPECLEDPRKRGDLGSGILFSYSPYPMFAQSFSPPGAITDNVLMPRISVRMSSAAVHGHEEDYKMVEEEEDGSIWGLYCFLGSGLGSVFRGVWSGVCF